MKNIRIVVILAVMVLSITSTSFAQGRFGLSYNTALPLGETADYIGKYSFRGFGLEARWEVAPEWYVGFNASWNTFYESTSGSFTEGTRTLTGTQYRYLNSYPLMLTAFKGFGERGAFSPYAGLGIGGIKVDKRSEMGLWQITENKWHFGLAPEIGTTIYTMGNFEILFSVRYNYAFKTGSVPAYSYLGINLGILL
jgi:opacity protein-like surface antigen